MPIVPSRFGGWKGALDGLTSVTLIACAIAVVSGQYRDKSQGQPFSALPSQPIDLREAPVEGMPSARSAIVEFADFECPYCATFARTVLPEIRREYIDTGKVELVFRQMPLAIHPHARSMSEATVCADQQGKFWEAFDLLFSRSAIQANQLSELLNLDKPRFRQCLSDTAQRKVLADEELGRTLGVRGTPMFFIGNKLSGTSLNVTAVIKGSRPMSEFRTALDDSLVH